MLKPDDLRSIPPEARTQLFESLATTFYGSTSFAVQIARDFDVARPTVFRWRREHNVPFAVLFALDAWVNSDAYAARVLEDWQTVPAQLSDAARAMASAASTMARIAKRMPDERANA